MATLDPWVVREAKAVVTKVLDGPTPPPAYAALSEGQKAHYRQKFLNTLYTDAGLNQFCQDKRVAYYTSLVEDCRPLMSRLPAKTSAQGRANANTLLNADPSSLPSSELRKKLKDLRKLKSHLDGLPAKKPTKVEEEVEEEVDASLTEMARAVLRESKLTDLDYAKKIGRRILHYEAAVKEGTPASHNTAGNLWRELRNSLAGWLAATDGAVKSIEAYQGKTSDRYLSAFAKKGYAPVSNGKTHVHAQWTQSIPKPLVEWQSEWPLYIPKNDGNDPITGAPGGSYTPAEVAQWLYEANLGRTYLSNFLSNYNEDVRPAVARSILEPYPVPVGTDAPPPLFALDSSEALGNGTAPDTGKVGATPLTPSFDLIVRGSTYFTGPLTQRATRLRVDLEAYVNQQTALKDAGKEQDPLGSIKFPALQSALNFLQKKTENESDSWSEVSQKTSARDPWIPLNILSAFASWKCQFPHSEWGEFFTHPSGVTPGEARWWGTVRGGGYTTEPDTRYEARRAIERGQTVSASSYDPFAGEKSVSARQEWPNPQTLKVGQEPLKPYRLEVVQLGPKGAYAYRTFDWFPHQIETNETFADIVKLYKLPSESEEEFTAAIKEENGVSDASGGSVSDPQLLAWIDGGGSPLLLPEVVYVPRVIPLVLLKSPGSPASSGGIAGPQKWNKDSEVLLEQFKAAPGVRTLGSNTVLKNYTRKDIRRLDHGISPIARLFIFYLNNDYSPYSLQKGLSDLFYKPATLYRALTGEEWPSSTGASSPPKTNDSSKAEYLGPGNFTKAKSRYSDWVNAYRTLYTKPWPGAQYINVEKEVAPNEEEQRAASAPDYEGTINPALIPLEGEVKERVFVKPGYYSEEPLPHRIGQGFLSRITRKKSGTSQLSSIERAMGIPETDTTLTNLGKEVKRSVQQLRITQFENLVGKAFLSWMDEEGPMGPKRLQYQKSLTAAYNRAWSGYFTPNRVEDGTALLTAKKGAGFAPSNKYNVRALYGPRLDLGKINPDTNKPYSTAISDKIARWNPKAIARQGTEKSLYPYQSDAVLRLVDKNGGLLAFDVGVGKTITSLAAVGMLKQQGKATRPVFLVPKSIKLKWWKDMKENYPDWRVGVFGMKIGYPQKASELDATSKEAYKRYKSKLAGRKADDETRENAEKAALLIVTGQASVREAIIKVWGKLPEAVKKRVKDDLNAKNPPMVPSWKREDDSDKLLKLQKFRDGYYDCLLLDEYDFKQIGISREKAGAHLLQSSPTFGYIFAKAFGGVTGFLGKPTRLRINRLTMAFEYLGLPEAMYSSPSQTYAPRYREDNKTRRWVPARSEGPLKDPTPFQNRNMTIVEYAQEDFLLETNGSLNLWPWCPKIAGDTFPFYDSVRAYIDSELPNVAGAKPGLFESLSDLFFERNLTRPRSAQDEEAFDYYVEILNADKDITGKASGAYIVGTMKGEESAEEVRKAIRNEEGFTSLNDAIKNALGPQAYYPTYKNFYPNLERSGTPGRYPDGTFIPSAQAIHVLNYNFSLPLGRESLPLIQEGVNGWEFVEPTITQTATDVAQIVADVINVDPSAYGLTGPVKVVEEFASDYPSPLSSRDLLTPPSRMDIAKKFTRLIKPYLGQTSAFEPPEITWEDLKVDSFIIDEAHKFKGLFEPGSRGGQVAYLTSGSASTQAWLMEYLTHTVKKRGGQVMLLTATPAKQSPVDFYNIVQLIGGRDLGPHENLYNLFNINTPEQFISRFVCVQERVIVNSNYEARRGIAATMFGPFGNLLTEFTQIFKRYSDRKTVADAPYLRGTTAATTRWNDYSPAQKSKQGGRKNAVLWANGTWDAEGDVVTTIGPSMEEVFKGGLPRARLRVWRGDDTGDFRILGWASTPRGDGTFENRVTVTPTFGSPAGSRGYDAQPWTIFKNTKVPVPVITKPVIRMGEIQKGLYESYQRALGLMMVEGTNSVRVEIDGAMEVVERRVIFATLSRLALHPELQAYSARFALETLDEDPEEEGEVESSVEDEALKEKNITAAVGQIFTDSIVASYREGIDPNPWTKGSHGKTLKSLQCFTGINEKQGLGHGGNLGWNGKAVKLNPQYLDLRDLYAEKSAEEGEAKAAGTEEEWGTEDSGMGVGGDLTNDELLRRLRTALDATLKNAERQAALSGKGKDWSKGVTVLNPATQAAFPTKGKENPVQNQTIQIPAKDGPDDPEVFKLNANASRTLGIADTIVAQKLRDTINPWMGSVTCGTIVFVNNLLYQGMQVMTICRLYAIAQAALYELKAYKKSLKGAVPSHAELEKILQWHGLGVNTASQASWECPYTTRALLTLTWPEANIENLDEHNTYAGDPDKSPSPLCKVIRKVQNSVHEKAFGAGTYSTPTLEGDGPVFQGSRYSFATVGDPELWVWLSEGASKGSEPKRWASYGVSGASLKSLYADAWVDMATKCCLMNAPMAPGVFREELAQQFNGEYIEVQNSQGQAVTKCIREPEYDVVIANQVAYEGIDLQKRTCRIINADLPFTPADLVQRNGRAIRNGNLYEKAEIQAVLALDTVDYYRIQAIERKRGWLDSALDEGKASYELTNDEVELLDLATKAVLPEQREAVRESVSARLEAIASESRERSLAPILNQLTIAATKQRTININSAADEEVYSGSIETNKKAKTVALRQSARPTGGCG